MTPEVFADALLSVALLLVSFVGLRVFILCLTWFGG